MPKTLFDKIWDAHQVRDDLLYIDLHLVHEVTSPQAFDGLRLSGRPVRRTDKTIATADHNVPTDGTKVARLIADELSRTQVETLERNCAEFGIPIYSLGSDRQGIVHVIGPELGLTQPGMTIVCGDSHTSTHGALGALAFGIGTSEVEHVLATQTLPLKKPKTALVRFEGSLPPGLTPKDVVLGMIGQIGVSGGAGYVLEYAGEVIRGFSMEGRMTLCNMSIEAGARAGMVAPDDTTFAYLEGRQFAPAGAEWERALDRWRGLASDPGALYDREIVVDVEALEPQVTWGRTRRWWRRSVASSPTRPTTPTPTTAPPSNARSPTWGSSRARRSRRSGSTASSSARARTRASRTCGRRPPSWPGSASLRA